MRPRRRELRFQLVNVFLILCVAVSVQAQTTSSERTFAQSKAAIDSALKAMQGSMAGHLPVLEGFAQPGEHRLERYERGYYQATAQVGSTSSGESLVRITTKITAWYADPAGAHSGYQLLKSNGRIEADLLDQLSQELAKGSTPLESPAESKQASSKAPKSANEALADSPAAPSGSAPKFPKNERTFSSLAQGVPAPEAGKEISSSPGAAEKSNSTLQAEAATLEEILKSQVHPKNLVAVKKSGTPVVATPSLTAKAQFLASAHDEFELLNFTADWVHVKISGISRGWIWRNSVEMPDGIADTDAPPAASALTPAADLFHVTREETAPFPGDWEPLRSKDVKIISVQKTDEGVKHADPKDRLEYAKFQLEKSYREIAPQPGTIAGVVVIFDSSDGGMIAATLPVLQQWRSGTLSDSAMWHKCFFDPPETFDSSASSASQ